MADYRQMWDALQGSVNNTARSMPWLGVPAIAGKPIVEAGLAGLEWGGKGIQQSLQGNRVDPSPSLYHMLNIYGLGGPAGGLTSGGKRAAPWFSAVGRAIEQSPLTQAPGQQWLGTLKNTPGVKQEEMDWTGLSGWLGEQKTPITKQQLADQFDANQVDVQEVVKGSKLPEGYQIMRDAHGVDLIEPSGRSRRLSHEEARQYITEEGGATKFQQYQLPGGENYRELLLTLPGPDAAKRVRIQELNTQMDEIAGRPFKEAMAGEAEHNALRAERDKLRGELTESQPFRGGHYDEPNVLAHVRFNDRVDASGKKTLFLEEIQSDWHQKGRKQGYKPGPHEFDEFKQLQARMQQDPNSLSQAEIRRFGELASAEKLTQTGVPDAPFKTTWPELALKRMIRWAAENGYDQIAWTPGKVQAARYDLSKQVDDILVWGDGKGGYHYEAKKDGKVLNADKGQALSESKLADTIGKELAEKAVARLSQGERAQFSGQELQVGGEGMKAFYDKMLVNAANKLGKKYGAKVGVGKVPIDNPGFDIVSDTASYATFGSEAAARRELNKIAAENRVPVESLRVRRNQNQENEVWSLPITPELKAKALGEGFPLFTGGKGGSLAAILNQALTGGGENESLGSILAKALR